MSCSLQIDRPDVSVTFRGPVELGAAIAALVARHEAGQGLPQPPEPPPAPRESRPRGRGLTSTERSRAHRARLAEEAARATDATPNATDATLHATAVATPSLAPAAVSISSPISSQSLAFSSSLGESPREGATGNATDATAVATQRATDATVSPVAVAPVALPDWARAKYETVRLTCGPFPASFDLLETWLAFEGHCTKTKAEPEAGGWQTWLTRQRSFDRSRAASQASRGRIVQRDPPGPKAYQVAGPDDEF